MNVNTLNIGQIWSLGCLHHVTDSLYIMQGQCLDSKTDLGGYWVVTLDFVFHFHTGGGQKDLLRRQEFFPDFGDFSRQMCNRWYDQMTDIATNQQTDKSQIDKSTKQKKHEICQQWSLWRNLSQPARSENSDDGLWSPCGDHLDDYHMGDVIRDQSFTFQVVGIDLMQRSGPRNEKTSPKSNVSEWIGMIYCAYLLLQVLIAALSNFAKKGMKSLSDQLWAMIFF